MTKRRSWRLVIVWANPVEEPELLQWLEGDKNVLVSKLGIAEHE